jgi:hypothetical protein
MEEIERFAYAHNQSLEEGAEFLDRQKTSEPDIFPESPWHQTSRFIPENIGIRI